MESPLSSRAGLGWAGRGWAERPLWMGLMREGAPARWFAPALSLSLWPRPCLSLAARYQGAFWEVLATRASTESHHTRASQSPHHLPPPPLLPVLQSHSSSRGFVPRWKLIILLIHRRPLFLDGSSGDVSFLNPYGLLVAGFTNGKNSITWTPAVTMDSKQAKTSSCPVGPKTETLTRCFWGKMFPLTS